jgi:3D (Asp-Asp-Asp) domain-containing protein
MKLLVAVIAIVSTIPTWARSSGPMRFEATAHSIEGITAKGTIAREGTVAADPAVLPMGTKIRISGAGAYSGVYVVTDTGRKVSGRHIDLYLSRNAEAKRFGRKTVTVHVLSYGNNKKDGREVTPKTSLR